MLATFVFVILGSSVQVQVVGWVFTIPAVTKVVQRDAYLLIVGGRGQRITVETHPFDPRKETIQKLRERVRQESIAAGWRFRSERAVPHSTGRRYDTSYEVRQPPRSLQSTLFIGQTVVEVVSVSSKVRSNQQWVQSILASARQAQVTPSRLVQAGPKRTERDGAELIANLADYDGN